MCRPVNSIDSRSNFREYFQIRPPQFSQNFREYVTFPSIADVKIAWSYASAPPIHSSEVVLEISTGRTTYFAWFGLRSQNRCGSVWFLYYFCGGFLPTGFLQGALSWTSFLHLTLRKLSELVYLHLKGKNIERGCLTAGCWEHLDPKQMKRQEDGKTA